MPLHLYAAATSNAQRASCMLEELGLPYTLHKVDLAKGAQKTPEFLAINPAGQVPALVDDEAGVTLAQSIAIVLYLAEKSGKLMPKDAKARANALWWVAYSASDVSGAVGGYIGFTRSNLADKPAPVAEWLAGRVAGALAQADKALADGRAFLCGAEFSVADVAFAPAAARAKDVPGVAGLAHLQAYLARVMARPGMTKGYAVLA
ncbi:MAG: glutathione S-transferase family protein [Tagaea sp.]|nr:glutathione S-transferase family protein [Tagaea sp.]